MGTLTASSLIAQASELLQDEDNITWSTAQGLEWLNDAQRALAIARPDASIETKAIRLVSGTRQTIDGHRLMSVIRNMGSNGTVPGRAIRRVDRETRDAWNVDWHTDTASAVVDEYMFDDRTPKEFLVYPPVTTNSTVWAEIIQSVVPAAVADITAAITVEDLWAPALIEWICFRFTERDSEETPDIMRQNTHFQRFRDILGVKTNIDMLYSPKTGEQLA